MNRSPCIGVCSTTYGDFVCRGCKRFAHEVVAWNQFNEAQRNRVWDRLSALLEQSIRDYLVITASRKQLRPFETPFHLLDCLKEERDGHQLEDLQVCLDRLALRTLHPHTSFRNLGELVLAIENAFLMRSEAHYEHSFSTSLTLALLPTSDEEAEQGPEPTA